MNHLQTRIRTHTDSLLEEGDMLSPKHAEIVGIITYKLLSSGDVKYESETRGSTKRWALANEGVCLRSSHPLVGEVMLLLHSLALGDA